MDNPEFKGIADHNYLIAEQVWYFLNNSSSQERKDKIKQHLRD